MRTFREDIERLRKLSEKAALESAKYPFRDARKLDRKIEKMEDNLDKRIAKGI